MTYLEALNSMRFVLIQSRPFTWVYDKDGRRTKRFTDERYKRTRWDGPFEQMASMQPEPAMFHVKQGI